VFPASCGLSGLAWCTAQEFHFSEDSTISLSTVQSNVPCPAMFRYASACAKWFFSPHSCSSTAASRAWQQQWQLYHTHHLWPIVSKVTVTLSSGPVESHHASWVLSIPFTWLRHRNQWECSGFESSRNTAYMTVRPFAVHLYTCNSIIMFCGSEFVTQWAMARVLTSQNLSSCTFLFYYSCVSWIGCTMSNWEACGLF